MQSHHQETIIFPLLFLLFISFIISKWLSQKSTTKKHLPLSPPRLPIIGNLHQLGDYPWRSFQTLSRKYGDMFSLQLGSRPSIVVSSSELASQILKTHGLVFANRPQFPIFKRLIGKGNGVISCPYGEHLRRVKAICLQDLFSKKKVESFRKVREEEVSLMVKEIERSRFVNLSEAFKSFGVDLMCRMCFGRKYRGIEIDFDKLVSEFVELVGGYYIGNFVGWLSWIDGIKGVGSKVNRVSKTFDRFIMGIIDQRCEQRNEKGGENQDDQGLVKDFVDVILDVNGRDSSRNYTLEKQDVKGLILDIFTAGSEAIFLVLEWMMSELIRNSRVMEELRKEVTTIIGNKNAITQDDMKNMNYLKAVLKETLRLHPAAPILAPHESTDDVNINGFHIAKGTLVLVNAWSISRDPRYWGEAENFYPERFLDSSVDFKGHDFEYIPFGSGRRMCPGIGLIPSIVELVVANLVYRFKWSLPDGEDGKNLDMGEALGLVVHRKKPLFAIASPVT